MRLREFYLELSALLNHFQSLANLFARLLIAYGFYQPALMKWSDFDATVVWFTQLGIPFPLFSTFLTASVEIVGVVLLALGLFTRIVTIPLMIILLVAIATVHISNGFSVVNNGFEIPLYYLLFLLFFSTSGAGRFSLDALMFGKER